MQLIFWSTTLFDNDLKDHIRKCDFSTTITSGNHIRTFQLPICCRLVGICLLLESFVRLKPKTWKGSCQQCLCAVGDGGDVAWLSKGRREGNEESFPQWDQNRRAMGRCRVMQWRVQAHWSLDVRISLIYEENDWNELLSSFKFMI